MDIGGGRKLSPEQVASWIEWYPDEYADYVDAGLFDPDSRELLDIPWWMDDGDTTNGPFDFNTTQSQGTSGW